MLTAFSGWMIFGEKLPGLWWVGAAGLVVGNVVIGRREEDGDHSSPNPGNPGGEREEERREGYRDLGEGDNTGISDGVELLDERRKSEDGVQR